ncbi:MAG: acyloxyacyl hydrolase [Gemmatimonadaceae bacterium]|nr:acyloxyacyl hydrolase [Gemmatimonadaceae bacterium]
MKGSCWLLAFGCWLVPAAASALPDSATANGSLGVTVPPARPPTAGPWWIGVWGALATHSSFDTRHGERHRDVQMLGVRFGRQLSAARGFAIDYYVDMVPLIRSTNIPTAYRDVVTCDVFNRCRIDERMETATVRGYGVTPIGLQLRAFAGERVQLVVGAGAGAAMYDRPVPDPGEKRLNFMGDVTAGVEVRLGRSGALLAGVRHNHTSNANTGPANPGLDTRVFYAGFTRTLGTRAQR